jgi:hypothetical protein
MFEAGHSLLSLTTLGSRTSISALIQRLVDNILFAISRFTAARLLMPHTIRSGMRYCFGDERHVRAFAGAIRGFHSGSILGHARRMRIVIILPRFRLHSRAALIGSVSHILA